MRSKDETSALIPKKSKPENAAITGVKLITAIPKGAGSWSSTFSPIAIFYKPGLWLIAPVATGSVISLTHQAVSTLAKKYPENQFLQGLNKGSFFVENAGSGFLADFGFAWSTITAIGGYIGGIEYHSNDFAKMIAPAIAFLPAVLTRRVNYKNAKNQLTERSLMRHTAETLRGMVAPGGVLGVLSQQGILDPESPIPTSIIAATGILGLLSSLLKESHPAISKTLSALINVLCENPSLAAAFFHFPNDIYAATTPDDEISDGFFFTNVAITTLFLITLTAFSVRTFIQPSPQIEEVDEEDIENGYISEDSEDESEEEDREVNEEDIEKGYESEASDLKKESQVEIVPPKTEEMKEMPPKMSTSARIVFFPPATEENRKATLGSPKKESDKETEIDEEISVNPSTVINS